jgi:hypothetical protein
MGSRSLGNFSKFVHGFTCGRLYDLHIILRFLRELSRGPLGVWAEVRSNRPIDGVRMGSASDVDQLEASASGADGMDRPAGKRRASSVLLGPAYCPVPRFAQSGILHNTFFHNTFCHNTETHERPSHESSFQRQADL